jgi:hypothetical protein
MDKDQLFYARYPELQGLSDDDWDFVILSLPKDSRDTLRRLLFPAPAPPEGGKDELVKRLRYTADIWERKSGPEHPLCKDLREAASLLDAMKPMEKTHG